MMGHFSRRTFFHLLRICQYMNMAEWPEAGVRIGLCLQRHHAMRL